MEYSVLYSVCRTNKNIFLVPNEFVLTNKNKKKSEILSGLQKNEKYYNLSKVETIPIEEKFVIVDMPIKQLKETYQTTCFEELKNQINLADYFMKIDKNNKLKPAKYEEFAIEEVKSNILCQDKSLEELYSAIIFNQKLYNSEISNENYTKVKKNILITGSTGVGKTESIKQITNLLQIPTIFEDMSQYVYESMTKDDVIKMLTKLLATTNYDVDRTQRAVIVFDNFESLADLNNSTNPYLFIDYILKTIKSFNDGECLNLITNEETKESAIFSKDCITLIFVGDFEKLLKKVKNKQVGYKDINEEQTFREKHKDNPYLKEIMDTITNIIEYKDLNEEDLENILLNSKISPLYLNHKFYKEMGIDLRFTKDYINDIAHNSYLEKENAKGLRYKVEESLNEHEFDLVTKNGYSAIELDKNKVRKLVKVRKTTKK